jgi:hypothetical protein
LRERERGGERKDEKLQGEGEREREREIKEKSINNGF